MRRQNQSHSRTFDKKLDAQAWASTLEQSIGRGGGVGLVSPHRGMTYGVLVEAYLGAVSVKRATELSLLATCRHLGAVPMATLNAYHLQGWIDTRLKEGVSGATIAHNLGLISGVLKWAKFSRQIDVNVELVRDARRSLTASKITTTSSERDRYITNHEIGLIRGAFQQQQKLKLPMIDLMEFALETAMRLGEIVRIEHEDLHHNAGTILIKDRKDPKRKEGNHMRVPLSSKARAIVARQPTNTGRIFPFAANSVSTAWIAGRTKAGVDDVTFHDLRHRAITDLFSKGLTIPQVALISGHKTWAQLRRYTQVQATDVVELLG